MSEQGNDVKEMAPSDGYYIDSYGHLLVNFGFIFTYLVSVPKDTEISRRKCTCSNYIASKTVGLRFSIATINRK